MEHFFVYLLLFTEILLLGYTWYRFKGDYVSPSFVTLSLFTLATACFCYNLNNWLVVFGFKAYSFFALVFLIMICMEAFVMQTRIRYGVRHLRKLLKDESINPKQQLFYRLYIPHPLDKLLISLFFLMIAGYIFRVYSSGISMGAATLIAAIGYNKEYGDYDTAARLLYNLVRVASYLYMVIFCNNVFTCKEKLRKNQKELFFILAVMVLTFFSGQRSTTIAYIVSFVVAISISIYNRTKTARNIDSRILFKRTVKAGIIIVAFFYLSANAVKATNVERVFVDYMTYYFGSVVCLMGRIVYEPTLCHEPFVGYFGEKTFMGFWHDMYSLGVVGQEPADRCWINMGDPSKPWGAGNEYTFLCGPYIDFGFVGALIFVALFYLFFSYFYYWKIRKNTDYRKRAVLMSIYLFLFTLVSMAFYQDTIRSYSRLINIAYIVYIIAFYKLFVRCKLVDKNTIYNNANKESVAKI